MRQSLKKEVFLSVDDIANDDSETDPLNIPSTDLVEHELISLLPEVMKTLKSEGEIETYIKLNHIIFHYEILRLCYSKMW